MNRRLIFDKLQDIAWSSLPTLWCPFTATICETCFAHVDFCTAVNVKSLIDANSLERVVQAQSAKRVLREQSKFYRRPITVLLLLFLSLLSLLQCCVSHLWRTLLMLVYWVAHRCGLECVTWCGHVVALRSKKIKNEKINEILNCFKIFKKHSDLVQWEEK